MKIQTFLAESEPDTRGPTHPFTKSGLGPAPFKSEPTIAKDPSYLNRYKEITGHEI